MQLDGVKQFWEAVQEYGVHSQEPTPGQQFLQRTLDYRRAFLFLAASCREVWPAIDREEEREVVRLVEQYADDPACHDYQPLPVGWTQQEDSSIAAWYLFFAWDQGPPLAYLLVSNYSLCLSREGWTAGRHVEEYVPRPRQATILASFATQTFPPQLRTPDSTAIATSIYDAMRYQDAPILADALEDTGHAPQPTLDALRDATFPLHRGNALLDFLRGRESEGPRQNA